MADSCKYVYDELVPEKDAVGLETVPDDPTLPAKLVVQQLLDDGTVLKLRKLTEGYSRSKNAARMCEKRKDPDYCKKENGHRKLQGREERALAKKVKLVRIPNWSILSETTREVSNKTQTDLKKYVERKKVETITVTTFIHSRMIEADKENADQVVVY